MISEIGEGGEGLCTAQYRKLRKCQRRETPYLDSGQFVLAGNIRAITGAGRVISVVCYSGNISDICIVITLA